jgi:coenzyme F420 hydrogenase subunit beta
MNIENVVNNQMCHGCGACYYICTKNAIELHNFIDTGIRPIIRKDLCDDCGDCINACSGINECHNETSWPKGIIDELVVSWGPVLEVWEGYAINDEIRFKGGSGGVTTALSLYCIEQEQMNGVLHVEKRNDKLFLNKTTLSRTYEGISRGAGSRYSPAAVCAELGLVQKSPTPCAVVGKPCEIASIQKIRESHPDLDRNTGLTISIFCGGTPATIGTFAVLDKLGVQAHELTDLRYRGHGWPGMTGVKTRKGDIRVEMTYQQAWDSILTKYIPFRCRICPDGTGEFADISCGDPWYRKKDRDENGTSLILTRTEKGKKFLQNAINAGYLSAELIPHELLPLSQEGLLRRRQHVLNKLFWLKVFHLQGPVFKGFNLKKNWLQLPLWRKMISMWRTGKWIVTFRYKRPFKLIDRDKIS